MRITEPMTLLTDYLLAAWSLFLALRLSHSASLARRKAIWLWMTGLLLISMAAALGGTYHGFQIYFESATRRTLWNATLYFIGLGSGFMLAGTCVALVGWHYSSTKWLLAGLVASAAGLVIQQSGIVFHQYFNHNDLSHCVQMLALYLFYRGVSSLRDR